MVSCTLQDTLALIRLEDGKANAMNQAFLEKLDAALDQARDARAVVLSSAQPNFFSGGLDLKTLPKLSRPDFVATVNLFERVMRRIFEWPVPVVAAVQGHALAGGAVLALTADYVCAADGNYKVGLNETVIGIPLPAFVLELGKLKLSPRFWTRAMLHGEIFPPAQAHTAGFLDELCADPLARSVQKAQELAKIPPAAYSATKRALRQSVSSVASDQLSESIAAVFLEGGLIVF